jgi:hypothetical protein
MTPDQLLAKLSAREDNITIRYDDGRQRPLLEVRLP